MPHCRRAERRPRFATGVRPSWLLTRFWAGVRRTAGDGVIASTYAGEPDFPSMNGPPRVKTHVKRTRTAGLPSHPAVRGSGFDHRCHSHVSRRLTSHSAIYSSSRRELTVRLDQGGTHSRARSPGDQENPEPPPWRGRQPIRRHTLTISSHKRRAIATRAFSAPLRTASRRPHAPRRSVAVMRWIAASTSAQRSHGDPRCVIRP